MVFNRLAPVGNTKPRLTSKSLIFGDGLSPGTFGQLTDLDKAPVGVAAAVHAQIIADGRRNIEAGHALGVALGRLESEDISVIVPVNGADILPLGKTRLALVGN